MSVGVVNYNSHQTQSLELSRKFLQCWLLRQPVRIRRGGTKGKIKNVITGRKGLFIIEDLLWEITESINYVSHIPF